MVIDAVRHIIFDAKRIRTGQSSSRPTHIEISRDDIRYQAGTVPAQQPDLPPRTLYARINVVRPTIYGLRDALLFFNRWERPGQPDRSSGS